MLGAIIGDMVGSVYEFNNTKRTDFKTPLRFMGKWFRNASICSRLDV